MRPKATLMLIALAISFSACNSPKEDSAANTNAPGASAPASPLDMLKRAYSRMEGAKTFRAKMTTTAGPMSAFESNMEVVLPDRIHLKNEQMEMIVIGSTAYMNMDGKWRTIPTGMDVGSLTDPKKLEETFGSSPDIKLIGSEALEGTPTEIYEARLSLPPSKNRPDATPQSYTSKIWIGATDGLPRKIEAEDPDSKAKTTVVYYDYGADIKIDPPAGK